MGTRLGFAILEFPFGLVDQAALTHLHIGSAAAREGLFQHLSGLVRRVPDPFAKRNLKEFQGGRALPTK
jgi:hypothetical protein